MNKTSAMPDIFKQFGKNCGFILFGIIIQAICLYVVMHKKTGYGYEIYGYIFVIQWFGYAIQLVALWIFTKKFWKSLAICLVTFLVVVCLLFVYSAIQSQYIKKQIEESKIFINEKDSANIEAITKEAVAKIPSTVSVDSPSYELSCPSSFVIPEGYGQDFPEKYELLTLYLPVVFEHKGEYPLELSYGSDIGIADKAGIFSDKKEINVPEAGRYVVKWVIPAGSISGYFIKSGKSSIKTNFAYSYSNNDIYPPDTLNQKSAFNYAKQTRKISENELEIDGVASAVTKVFPDHLQCQQAPEITLLQP